LLASLEAVTFDGCVEVEAMERVAEVDVGQGFDPFQSVEEGVAVDEQFFGCLY
jgi:hypothetical protein